VGSSPGGGRGQLPVDYDRRETPGCGRAFGVSPVLSESTAVPSASSFTCACCGAPFKCGRDDAAGCWCARLPPLARSRYDAAAGCLCEPCLRAAIDASCASSPGSTL
jgi:hypothetical protein